MQANATESRASSSPHSWGVSKTGSGEYAENLRQRGDSHGVIVAVVDSGVESSHPFLKNRLIAGYDFIQYDEIPQDEHGHGTHVTGTIVDCTPDMDVKIMPVRVLDAFASGSYLSIANGIRYAADHGANIINLSLGSTNHSQTIDEAVNYALSKNITVVVAAGNKMGNVDYFCPAHMENCITVAAVDSDLKRYELSNYGDAVDMAAPGVGIESSILKGKYGEMNGTSMATPHVSAAAALLMSERGTGQTPFQISSLLRDAATDVGEPGKDVYFGAGFLNMRPLIQRNAYALLYADGELVFQKNNTPALDRALIKSYPVAISRDGSGQYAAWHDRHSDIRKVTFAESIRPTSTALWFYGCENLSEVHGIENLNASGLTDMSQMFARCGSLKTLDLSDLDTSAVSKMNSMFFHCEALTELDLTGWNTKSVTDTRDMFIGCAALKTVYASDSFSMEKTTDSEGMFQGCHALVGGQSTPFDNAHTDKEYAHIDGGASAPGYFTDKNAPLPSNDIYAVLYSDGELVFQNNERTKPDRSVTDVYKVDKSYAKYNDASWYGRRENITLVTFADKIQPTSTAFWFSDCTKLSEIRNINNLDTSNVTSMSGMFFNCSGLTTLDVSRFNTANVTDMVGMFYSCSELTALDVSHFDTASVTSMASMFNGCKELVALDLSAFNTSNVIDMSGMFFDCSELTLLDLSRFDTANVEYMHGMFCGCSGLTALDVSSFSTSNVTNMRSMFNGCISLETLDVSGFDTSNVTDMGGIFRACKNLTVLDIGGFDTSNVTCMGGMFCYCSSLDTLDVSSFNTCNVTDMGSMFFDCGNLGVLDVSGFNTSNVNNMDSMFYGCGSLEVLDVSGFDTVNVIYRGGMFCGCHSLTSLDLSSFDTRKVTQFGTQRDEGQILGFGAGMFEFCTKLKTIYTSETFVTTQVQRREELFSYCTSLIGGAGTKYSDTHIDISYARIDEGASAPGYFTRK